MVSSVMAALSFGALLLAGFLAPEALAGDEYSRMVSYQGQIIVRW